MLSRSIEGAQYLLEGNKMILYLAGSFPLLTNLNKERAFKESIEARGKSYNRLVSQFYPKTVATVLALREEEIYGQKNVADGVRLQPRQRKLRENVAIPDEKVQVDSRSAVPWRRDVQARSEEGIRRTRSQKRS